jgi:hypothetical protein
MYRDFMPNISSDPDRCLYSSVRHQRPGFSLLVIQTSQYYSRTTYHNHSYVFLARRHRGQSLKLYCHLLESSSALRRFVEGSLPKRFPRAICERFTSSCIQVRLASEYAPLNTANRRLNRRIGTEDVPNCWLSVLSGRSLNDMNKHKTNKLVNK